MHKDKQAAIEWAKDILLRDDWLICDSETSGLGPTAEMCQIAMIDRHGNTLLDMLLRPIDGIPADATAIHGITNEMVERSPSFVDAWPVIKHLLTLYYPVIYNVQYDLGVIVGQLERHNLYRPSLPGTCAMKKYAAFVGEPGRYGDWKWQKLPATPGVMAHSALGDCLSTLAIIKQMAGAVCEKRADIRAVVG